MSDAITITKPMVLVPLEKYEELLREIGEKPTPRLSKASLPPASPTN